MTKQLMVIALSSALVFSGCATSPTHAPEGAAIGAAAGAALGAIASDGHGAAAPLAFGLFGAAMGAVIGDQYRKVPPASEYVYAAPAQQNVIAGSTDVIVTVPNTNGTTTTVVLKRSQGGFIGPQGEYYPTFPSMAQLRAMYGR